MSALFSSAALFSASTRRSAGTRPRSLAAFPAAARSVTSFSNPIRSACPIFSMIARCASGDSRRKLFAFSSSVAFSHIDACCSSVAWLNASARSPDAARPSTSASSCVETGAPGAPASPVTPVSPSLICSAR